VRVFLIRRSRRRRSPNLPLSRVQASRSHLRVRGEFCFEMNDLMVWLNPKRVSSRELRRQIVIEEKSHAAAASDSSNSTASRTFVTLHLIPTRDFLNRRVGLDAPRQTSPARPFASAWPAKARRGASRPTRLLMKSRVGMRCNVTKCEMLSNSKSRSPPRREIFLR